MIGVCTAESRGATSWSLWAGLPIPASSRSPLLDDPGEPPQGHRDPIASVRARRREPSPRRFRAASNPAISLMLDLPSRGSGSVSLISARSPRGRAPPRLLPRRVLALPGQCIVPPEGHRPVEGTLRHRTPSDSLRSQSLLGVRASPSASHLVAFEQWLIRARRWTCRPWA